MKALQTALRTLMFVPVSAFCAVVFLLGMAAFSAVFSFFMLLAIALLRAVGFPHDFAVLAGGLLVIAGGMVLMVSYNMQEEYFADKDGDA